MSFLVTGGAGFLGAYLVRKLVSKGEEVIIYDWKIKDSPMELILRDQEIAKLKIFQGDVSDLVTLLNVIRQYQVTKIIHLAACTFPVSEAHPSIAIRVNCQGTSNVFEAARILGLEKVVWSSSNAVFGNFGLGKGEVYGQAGIGLPVSQASKAVTLYEDSPHSPSSAYGSTKTIGEFMTKYYAERFQLDIVCLRIGQTFGMGKITGGAREFSELVWKVAKNEPTVIPNADFVRPYAYVEDVVDALVLAAEAGKTKTKIFNTHGFEHRTNREFAKILQRINPEAKITVKPTQAGDFPGFRYDCSKIIKELGFSPKYTLEDGLRIMFDTFKGMKSIEDKVTR